MKYWTLVIRVSKGKNSNNNNILAQNIANNIRWILEKSGFQAWKDFEKNEF